MAKGLVLNRDGGGEPAEVLELVDTLEKPRALPGFVVVHLTVRPINPTDFLNLRGFYGGELTKGSVIGVEGCGIVEEVGEGVTNVRVGERVVPLLKDYDSLQTGPIPGAFQEYVAVPASAVYSTPDKISDDDAAQIHANPWSAFGILEDLQVPKGEYILQTAAGSVLGRMVIQLAKHWGIRTINVVRRDELKGELKAIGADEVINSSTEDVVARVKEITRGKLVYAAIDAVAGESTKICASVVRDGGSVVVYGAMSSHTIALNIVDLFRNVQVKAFYLPGYVASRQKRDQVAADVFKLVEEKVITPLTGKKFTFEEFKEAFAEAEKSGRGGKVLIVNTRT